MALNPLTLSTSIGIQGRPFQASVFGLNAGSVVDVLPDGAPGFSVVNGRLRSEGLPYPTSTVVLRERLPGTGYRDSRIEIEAMTPSALLAQAGRAIGTGRTMNRFTVAGRQRADGSYRYAVFTEDDLGATDASFAVSRLPNAPTTINATTSTTGWTANSGAVLATKAYPVPHPSGATQGLSITCAAADTFASARSTSVPAGLKLSNTAIVGLWLYWSGTQGSVGLRFTSDNFVGKNKTFAWAWSGQLHQGWNLLTIRPDDDGTTSPGSGTWTVAGGFLDTDTVNGVEVQINTNGAAATEVFLGGIFYFTAAPTRGAVRFGFDRFGEASIPQLALPILRSAGIVGYWAGDGNLIQSAGTSRTYLQQVYDAGWDAISQGMNHPDYTVAGAVQLSADYDTAKEIFRSLGFVRGLNMFAYPLSANNDATDAVLLGKGVQMARSGWAWDIRPSRYAAGPKLVGHGAVNIGGKTLATAKKLIDRAVSYGTTVDLFTHGLVAGGDGTSPPADTLVWYANDYQALVDYAVGYRTQGLLDIDSPSQWLDRRQIRATRA